MVTIMSLWLPKEDDVMDALRPFSIPPGEYHMPYAGTMKEMGTPEFTEKMNKGPMAFMTVLESGADYRSVFRFAGCTALIGYSAALWQNSIWYKRAWSSTLQSTFDGLVYALFTAGIFGWLWP